MGRGLPGGHELLRSFREPVHCGPQGRSLFDPAAPPPPSPHWSKLPLDRGTRHRSDPLRGTQQVATMNARGEAGCSNMRPAPAQPRVSCSSSRDPLTDPDAVAVSRASGQQASKLLQGNHPGQRHARLGSDTPTSHSPSGKGDGRWMDALSWCLRVEWSSSNGRNFLLGSLRWL